MKFYCIKTYKDLHIEGKFYNCVLVEPETYYKRYRIKTEKGDYAYVTNPIFVEHYFVTVKESRKLKLERIYERG